MKALKKYTIWSIAAMLAFSVTSCSSYSDIPSADVYYSKKTSNSGEYNWEDFQKSAQSHNTVPTGNSSGDEFDYNSNYQTDVAEQSDYEYIDEYYDSDYDSRIKRFNDGSSDRDYYDDYYTSGSGCGCGSNSNFSMSFGFGMGYGYGYPYYGYGYPYYGYGYPYYGSSYWAGYYNGYNNGYYNGYNNGYYGGGYYPGYGGGYYPDYGASYVAYGPRGSKSGGTTVPKSRGGSTAGGPDEDNKSGGVVAGRGISNQGAAETVASTSTISARRTAPTDQRPESSVRVREDQLSKPATLQQTEARGQEKMKKPETKTTQQLAPRYEKPKSYQSLPSRQPRSSKEYVRPSSTPTVTNRATAKTPYTQTRKPSSTNVRGTNTRSVTSGTRSNTYQPSKSYSSPSRSSSTPSKSYSSPSRNSGSYSSPSRSSSTPSRSSSSSSSSSRGSGSGGKRR